ncbi:hypothetical protein [Franconibacter helveticus]|uniref:hypothetical protein n=1 Tax=Franconibacter helveticus TaxID=357240 RepID=UPI00066EF8AA|nr:hypothetical protein [Franconibacter helveticus]
MKTFTFILLAALIPAASATAAIEVQGPMARNMDDVHSLGVIYINHNRAAGDKTAQRAFNEAELIKAEAAAPVEP